MSSNEQAGENDDWGAAVMSALHHAEGEDDQEGINFVSGGGGLATAVGGAEGGGSVAALQDATTAIKSNEISMDEFVTVVGKVQTVANNALKLYAIPAVRKDLPGKLTEKQNELWLALEAQLLLIKEGTETMLAYATNSQIGELESGLDTVVKALKSAADIQKQADAEYAAIMEREKEEKAARAQKAAEANAS
jgi:hypothetical protein